MITLSKLMPVRIRLSDLTDRQAICMDLDREDISYTMDRNWLYLFCLPIDEPVAIPMHFVREIRDYTFNNHDLRFQFEGDHVIAARSKGKRLCFFPELEEREQI